VDDLEGVFQSDTNDLFILLSYFTMIQLEPFTEADFDRLISWIDSPELLLTIAGPVFTYPLTADQLQRYRTDPKSHSFNVVDATTKKVVGHAEIVTMGNGIFKIDKLIIGDTSIRGKGIGQAVINQLLDYSFSSLKATTVELNVFDWNIAAIKCYEKCGFKVNPDKQSTFQMGDEQWIALNMYRHYTDYRN
jgi:RimJ/RimL family protein N-acetyltransferase